MPRLQVKPGPYARLLKLAAGNGSHANIGTVIGDTSEAAVALYLAHMKATDPSLWKTWGSKAAATPVEEDDNYDPTAEDDDPPVEATKGLGELFAEDPDLEMPNPPVKKAIPADPPQTKRGLVPTPPPGHILMDGVAYPPVFKFRNAEGITVELELMSKNPQWGFMLRHLTPTDPRTFSLGGKDVTVDLLTLRRDPDGMTELNGKKYSNSKLIAAAELATDD